MSVAITLRGSLDGPLVIDDDFSGLVHQLNMNAAQGRMFALFQDTEANPIIINLHEILVCNELEGDDPASLLH